MRASWPVSPRAKGVAAVAESGPRSYLASEAMLERALRVIPLGAQTFSKSLTQYPRGADLA